MKDRLTAEQSNRLIELAREYAEACGNGSVVVENRYDIMTEVLQFILRDHCIVRKNEVEKEIDVNEFFEFGSEHSEKATGALTTLRNLFPDLFKHK